MSHRNCTPSLLLVFSLLTFFRVPSFATETMVVAVAPGPLVSIFNKIKEPFLKETGIQLESLVAGGISSLNAILAVDTKKVEIGLAAMDDWESSIKALRAEGASIKNLEQFKITKLGVETTHLILHPDLKVNALSKEDLGKILSGQSNTWKDFGGPDIKIQFAMPIKFQAAKDMVIRRWNNGHELRPSTKFLGSFDDIVEFVRLTPGAMALGPRSILTAKVGQPKHPPLDRETLFFTLGEPSKKAALLRDYIVNHPQK